MPLHFHFHLIPSFKTTQNKTKIPYRVVSTPLTKIINRKIFTQQLFFFSPPEWVCHPSGLNQQSIKDKTNKSRSLEISFWTNTRRNHSHDQVHVSQRSESAPWSYCPKIEEDHLPLLCHHLGTEGRMCHAPSSAPQICVQARSPRILESHAVGFTVKRGLGVRLPPCSQAEPRASSPAPHSAF